ncbi:MAG: hypothetical protein OZ921_21395 [Sorangiineae bacterium]|nr:hypothetical protein [Polyangiaceae bacterium]MEB2325083.1 hypothetical protein [Sorangiineae bacterium]
MARTIGNASRAAALGLALALGSAAVAPPLARAQDAADLSKARTLFRQGVSLEAAGDWAGALAKFEAVAKVKLSPQVRFHLGRCKENLGRLNEALGDYRLAEYEAREAGAKELGEITGAREALEARVPKLIIQRGAGAESARVELDGVDVGEAKLGKELAVDPGRHRVVATLPRKGHFEEEIEVAEGETKTLELVPPAELLAAEDSTRDDGSDEGEPSPSAPPKPAAEGGSVVPWVIGGVGAVGLVSSGVFYALRGSKKSELDSGCRGSVCPERLRDAQDQGKLYSTLSGVALGVGVLGVGVAAVMLLSSGSDDAPADPGSQESARLRVDVTTTSSLTGVQLRGTF